MGESNEPRRTKSVDRISTTRTERAPVWGTRRVPISARSWRFFRWHRPGIHAVEDAKQPVLRPDPMDRTVRREGRIQSRLPACIQEKDLVCFPRRSGQSVVGEKRTPTHGLGLPQGGSGFSPRYVQTSPAVGVFASGLRPHSGRYQGLAGRAEGEATELGCNPL